MDRETSAKVFHYQFSKASKFTNSHVMGYGLPLARLYARYFGGDLRVTSYDVSGATHSHNVGVTPGVSRDTARTCTSTLLISTGLPRRGFQSTPKRMWRWVIQSSDCIDNHMFSVVEQTGRGEQLEQQHLVQDGVVGGQGGAEVPARRDGRHEEAGRPLPQARCGGADQQECLGWFDTAHVGTE